MSHPLIEVLTFEGCPHTRTALELVERIVNELGIEASIRHVDVADLEQAEAHRFLGSPTIRVNGHDIEPGSCERSEYTLACRIYGTDAAVTGECVRHANERANDGDLSAPSCSVRTPSATASSAGASGCGGPRPADAGPKRPGRSSRVCDESSSSGPATGASARWSSFRSLLTGSSSASTGSEMTRAQASRPPSSRCASVAVGSTRSATTTTENRRSASERTSEWLAEHGAFISSETAKRPAA
jgi:hypothetical protein